MFAALKFDQIVGIAVIATLALTALIAWIAWRYRQRPQPDPSIDRRRQAAEDAAEELTDTRAFIDGVWLGLLQHGRGYFKRPEADEERGRLREAGLGLDRRKSRLAIAFGPDSDAVAAFNDAADAANEIHGASGAIRDLYTDSPIRGDEYAERQVDGYFDKDRERVREQRDRYAIAVERFEAAAGRITA